MQVLSGGSTYERLSQNGYNDNMQYSCKGHILAFNLQYVMTGLEAETDAEPAPEPPILATCSVSLHMCSLLL